MRELVEIDMNYFGAVLQVVARVIAMEAVRRGEVAAAQHVVEVDVAVNVRRNAVGGTVGVVGDEQTHRDMRRLETFGKIHGGVAADGMADRGDRLRVAAVVADRLVRHAAPHQVGIDVCLYAGAVDARGKFVHPPIDQADQTAKQVGAAVRLGGSGLVGGGSGEARCDQDSGNVPDSNHRLHHTSGDRPIAGTAG